ncbi:4Fe-4S binding protein [Desulfurivibrio sp. D14AmB]|uniref:4Fe-4S binding protein n=1 Tax=Desulfurivibrio sp. D14AmB TaxID=3374370 RepID=UPI00376F2F14
MVTDAGRPMTLAERLLARLSRPRGVVPEYVGPRCLRRRFIRSTCRRCLEECPVQALSAGEGEVGLDSRRCTGCLACVAVCPSGALVARDPRPGRVAERLFARAGGGAVLCCEKGMRDGSELLLPCLGMLSREELALFALLAGSLTLRLHPCQKCHSPQVPALLQGRVEQLVALGGGEMAPPPIELRLVESPAGGGGGVQSETEPAGGAPGDRRDFFRACKTLSFQAAVESWGVIREEPERPEERWASTKHLPPRFALLERAWSRWEAEPGRRNLLLPLLTMVTVGDQCTHCGACVGLCPSGAISSEEGEEGSRLLFSWSRCCACGLCREFCPARAITLDPVTDPARLAERTREIHRR